MEASRGAFDEYARSPKQALQLAPLSNALVCMASMLKRIIVAARRVRSGSTAMHSTPAFPLTAGAMQGLPERVVAPQRRLEGIGPSSVPA